MAEPRNTNLHFYVRRRKRLRENEEEDYNLSSLPDELLINILSRLSINSAATTSILSRRWRHLWTAVTRLQFHFKPSTITNIIVINHIFQKLTVNLTSIDLNLCSLVQLPNPNSTKSLFSQISRQNVSNITVNAMNHNYGDVFLPSCLFNSPSLETLILYGKLVIDSPLIRGIIHVPNLTNLILKNLVEFSADWLRNLIRCCPLLEHLDLVFHFSPGKLSYNVVDDNVEIFSPNLKKLNIELYSPSQIPRPRIYIDAPKLTNLHICDCISLYYLVKHPTSLDKVCIDIRDNYEDDTDTLWLVGDKDYLRHMSKFVRGLSSACRLELHVDGGTNLFPYLHLVDDGAFPVSCNSTCVEFTLENICYNYWTDVLLFLQCFPNLKHLEVTLYGDSPIPVLPPQNWCAPDFVPHCLSSELKTINISGFFEIDFDIKLLAYILGYALVLEELDVSVYFKDDVTEEAQLSKERTFCRSLFKLPRRSSTCEVVFTGPNITASSNDNKDKYITCNVQLESWLD